MKVIPAVQDAIDEGVESAVLLEEDDINKLTGDNKELSLHTQDEIIDLGAPRNALFNNGCGLLINLEIHGKQGLFPVYGLAMAVEESLA